MTPSAGINCTIILFPVVVQDDDVVFFSMRRSPPADHWALVSGLPTYVAETGLVSVSSFVY